MPSRKRKADARAMDNARQNIRALMAQQDINQKQLCAQAIKAAKARKNRTTISQTAISNFLSGKTKSMGVHRLELIADVFGRDVGLLLVSEAPMPPGLNEKEQFVVDRMRRATDEIRDQIVEIVDTLV